jgi:hypothetical protein
MYISQVAIPGAARIYNIGMNRRAHMAMYKPITSAAISTAITLQANWRRRLLRRSPILLIRGLSLPPSEENIHQKQQRHQRQRNPRNPHQEPESSHRWIGRFFVGRDPLRHRSEDIAITHRERVRVIVIPEWTQYPTQDNRQQHHRSHADDLRPGQDGFQQCRRVDLL